VADTLSGAPIPRRHGPGRDRAAWIVGFLAALMVVGLDIAFARAATGIVTTLVMAAVVGVSLVRGHAIARSGRRATRLRALMRFEIALVIALAGFCAARGWLTYDQLVSVAEDEAGPVVARTYDGVFLVLAGLSWGLVISPERSARMLLRAASRPGLLLSGSFVGLIAVGTLMLVLPMSLRDVDDVSIIDSLFTMTSAVCVTGLTVNDVSTNYSRFGQTVILLGIQLGGMGIMTVAALALTMVRSGSLHSQRQYAAMMDARTLADLRTMVRSIVVGTLVIESLGALALWALLDGHPAMEGRPTAFHAVFHAVSAFCNAGFALFPNNLVPFVDDPAIQVVLGILIVTGGIGFPVIVELTRHAWAWVRRLSRRGTAHPGRMTLSTWVVLRTTFWLILVGAVATWLLEWGGALAHRSHFDRIVAAFFASVNTRTAGFNTVDVGSMKDATWIVFCILMFIGGSPVSTAGGIKTTTFAVMFATLRAELRGCDPELGHRAVAPEDLRKATAVVVLSASILVVVVLGLSLTEEHAFVRLLFEAVSAFATVGLSTGITADLSVLGKLLITLTMFIGRVGPLTIALAVGREHADRPYRLAPENLPVG
jgi:trk system potassium uptake protein TrkH